MLLKIGLIFLGLDLIGLVWIVWEAREAIFYVDPRLNYNEKDWQAATNASQANNVVHFEIEKSQASTERLVESVASNA